MKKSSFSTIWSSMVKSLPIITNDLSWQMGREIQIHLGLDRICGIGDDFKLSWELVMELHCKNILLLNQIHLVPNLNRWADSFILGLAGHFAEEWYLFISKLYHGNIMLNDKPDKLVWSVNAREGLVTASLAYRSIVLKSSFSGSEWWMN